MKKIILSMVILFSFIGLAQTQGLVMTSKVLTWTDSLQYKTDAISGKDSVIIIPISYRADNFRIYLDGNTSTTSVDSVTITLGARVYTNAGVCVDTTWGSATGVKDSAWNTLNTLVNSTTGKDYSLYFMPPVDLMKFALTNYRAAKPTRLVRFTLQGTKY